MEATPRKSTMLRLPHVEARLRVSRSTIYELVARGLLARPIKLTGRAVGWLESDVDAYIDARVAARDGGAQ
jgi:prophage regulatory protein